MDTKFTQNCACRPQSEAEKHPETHLHLLYETTRSGTWLATKHCRVWRDILDVPLQPGSKETIYVRKNNHTTEKRNGWAKTVDEEKEKIVALLKGLTHQHSVLQHCFQLWKIHMQRCKDRGETYVEGDNS